MIRLRYESFTVEWLLLAGNLLRDMAFIILANVRFLCCLIHNGFEFQLNSSFPTFRLFWFNTALCFTPFFSVKN